MAFELKDRTFEAFYEAYARVVADIVENEGLERTKFTISLRGLADVMREAQKDILMMQNRRPLKHGASRGKWAGVLVFRLCRNNVLLADASLANNKDALKIPVISAVAFGLEMIHLNINSLPSFLIRELKFYVAKRHINQEALGICFDALYSTKCKGKACVL